MNYTFDLHFHSCLSPCGSDDMTPANLAAMCALAGLDIVALTDHNTAGNCRAFCRAAESRGLLAFPGMELCTREEIHLVCLFPTVDAAEDFAAYVAPRLPPLKNDRDYFGPQLYMDEGDLVLGEETCFLAGSADIGVEDAPALVSARGGLCYPAHIDRPAYSLLSVLGLWEPSMGFPLAEVSHRCPPELKARRDLQGVPLITASDAHCLDQVRSPSQSMALPALTREAVLHFLAENCR